MCILCACCFCALSVCTDVYQGRSWVSLFSWYDGDKTLLHQMDSASSIVNWKNCFNLVSLRMISYSLDYYWSFDADKTMSQIRNLPKIASIDERSRISDSHLPEIYDQFVLYIAYVLYLPLYIAGPIMTFNNFVSHLIIPQRNYSLNQKVKYAALRFCIPFALFFIGTHYVYVSAIANMGYTYFIRDIDGPVPLIEKLVNDGWLDVKFVYIYTYYTLLYLYLKFLVIWRFFRLWAIFDDVEPCENMGHCIVNTHSLSGFWRSWHKSFNQWLIRYMYIPLGGNKFGFSRQVLSIIVIFTFVSFWHDLTMKLFTWDAYLWYSSFLSLLLKLCETGVQLTCSLMKIN